jgi:hypothetical protein
MAKIMDFEPGDIISPENKSIQYEVLGYDKDTNEYKIKIVKTGEIRDAQENYDGFILVKKSEKSKEKETKMFNNAKEQINMNKEIAIQESEKQLGKIILDQVEELDLFKDLPGFVQDFLKKPFGKWITVNSLIFLSNFYTGPMKEELDYVKRGLLRASYSELGDTYINNFFNKILANIKDKLPKKDS